MGRETLGKMATGIVGLGVIETLVEGLEEEHAVSVLDTNSVVESEAQALIEVHVAHNDRCGDENDKE
jgi:hypothetical protein